MLEIRVLGDLTVHRGGEAVALPPSKKTRALIAYLAIVDRPQRRERLCEMFWEIPDDPRGALRWSLSKIRQVLGGENGALLSADRNMVSLDSSRLDLDIAPLLDLSAGDIEAKDTDTLEDLATRFRGLFLDDLYMPRCPEFEAWRIGIANELEVKRLRMLRLLVDRLSDDPARALHHAHVLHALQPEDGELRLEIARLSEAARQTALVKSMPQAASEEDAAPVPLEPKPALTQEIRYCTARDGVQLAYALSGEGLPIVRAANWMSHLELEWESPVWRHWTEALSSQNTFVRYDQRGNGLSEREPADVSFEAMVSDLESIVDAAGFRRFYLLGVSQGCAFSIAYAVRHPERIAGMILCGGFAKGWRKRDDPVEVARRAAMGELMRDGWGQKNAVFRQMFTSIFIPEGTPDQMEWFNELQRKTVTPEVAHAIYEAGGEIDVEPLLAKVRVPTLVLHGTRDSVIPFANGEQLAKAIRGARFVPLESANHIMLAHEPAFQTFVEETRRFIADPEIIPAAAAPTPVREIERSRQTVTMLSVEIVSPMHVFEQDDPEQEARELRPLLNRVAGIIETHFGVVTASMEGTIMAAFGLSTATEDHAFLACRAALAAQRAVEDTSLGAARLRAAIDTGDVIVEQGADGTDGRLQMSGSAPRVAGRLMRALRRATIAVSARARAAAGGYVRMQLMAPSDHPQVGRDDRIHELLGENQALSRWHLRAHGGLTDLTGREAELTVLRSAWRRVREGHGQIVGIVSEPGLGKSRLTHEFISMPEVASFQVLETGALEFARRTPLGVMKTLLLTACGIAMEDDLKPAMDRLAARLKELDLAPELLVPLKFLADMKMADEEWSRLEAREKTMRVSDALRSFLVAMSRRSPLVILFEDLHWIDTESELVLNRLADSVSASRILLIATYRPDYLHDWGRRGCFQQIRLERFMKDETREFLTRLLGDDPGLHDLREMLAENAEGTPLYLEEMVRMLLERGNLRGEPGAYTLDREVAAIDVPPSVQSLVAARVNQLAPAERQVLQLAAVIGRNVPAPLLTALAPVGALELAQALSRLQTQEFLFEVQSLPHPEYMFKHAITQRVAYDSILLEDRRRLHGDILGALEKLSAGSESHYVETLAEHAIRAEAWEAAARYAKEAAARAEGRSAFRTAARFLEDARQAVSMLPETARRQEQEIDIAVAMRPICGVLGEYEKASVPLTEARVLAEKLGDQDRLYEVLLHQSYLNSTFGNFDEAFEPAEAMKQSALVSGTPRCVAEADLAASQALLLRSRAREVVKRLTPHRDGFLGEWRYERFGQMGIRSVWYLGHLAQSHARLGAFDKADEAILRAREIATEVQRPIDLSSVVYFAGIVDLLRGPTQPVIEEIRGQVDIESFGAGLFIRGWLLPILGHALFLSGDNEGACDTLEEAIDYAAARRLTQCEVHARAVLACARTRLGLPEAASNLEHALELARRQCDPWAEILVLRGLAELKPSRTGLDYLEQACELARRAEIAPELARTLTALGLRRRRAKVAKAEDCLAEASTMAAAMKLRDVEAVEAERAVARQPEPVATM